MKSSEGVEVYLVQNIPFQKCANCGERELEREVSEAIYSRIRSQNYVREKMEISTFELAANL